MTKKFFRKAFTLVELIIVIAIIAILAVVAFLLLTKWLGRARDASRSSNLASIDKALQVHLAENATLPKPDDYTLIYASGINESIIAGYQGYFGETVKDTIGNIDKAPKDGNNYFLYYLNSDLKKYQIASFMENQTSYNPNTANANEYENKFIYTIGNNLGMLFNAENKTPINQMGITGIDLINYTGTDLQMIFSKNKFLQGTGKNLKGGFVGEGLVGYYPFDETEGTTAYDSSPSYNNGTLSGVTLPTWTEGKVGNALQFTSNISSIYQSNSGGIVLVNKYIGNENFLDNALFTFSFWAKGNEDSDSGNYVEHPIKNMTSNSDGLSTFAFSRNHSQRIFRDSNAIYQAQEWTPSKTKTLLRKDVWYFIVGSFDGKNLKVYINGLLENSVSIQGQIQLGNSSLHIGCGGQTGIDIRSQCFRGIIDEVRVYNRALSDNEVMMLYNVSK